MLSLALDHEAQIIAILTSAVIMAIDLSEFVGVGVKANNRQR